MKTLTIIVLAAILSPSLVAGPKHKATSKPVHVASYTTKKGTAVKAHDRALPGTANHKKKK